jgi:hypothetical protein
VVTKPDDAVEYAKFFSRSHHAVIRAFDAPSVISGNRCIALRRSSKADPQISRGKGQNLFADAHPHRLLGIVIWHFILSSLYGHSVTRCAFTVDVDGRNIKGVSRGVNKIGHIK